MAIRAVALFNILIAGALLLYFPGRQVCLAFTLSTGLGVSCLQQKVDELEKKAIKKKPFSEDDKALLKDLYTCLAKGAKLTIILRQSAQMLERYLSCTGEPLETKPRIFIENIRVQEKMKALRNRSIKDLQKHGSFRGEYATGTFYMPHRSSADSVFGLYYGRIILCPELTEDHRVRLHWRAEVPWEWPSYESLHIKYGNYHAESFPLPNARAILHGSRFALHIDNGLGQYLTHLELARPFLVFAEWDETLDAG